MAEEQRAAKDQADAVIKSAINSGMVNPEIKLGDLIKLGADSDIVTLGYVAAWERYALVVK